MKQNTRYALIFLVLIPLLLTAFALPFAAFAEDPTYTLQVSVINANGDAVTYGTVQVLANGDVIQPETDGNYIIPSGGKVTLNGLPQSGYEFVKWTFYRDGEEPQDILRNPTNYLNGIASDYRVEAVFEPITYSIYYVGESENYGFEYTGPEYSIPSAAKREHTYGTATELPEPRLGGTATHLFSKWLVYRRNNPEDTPLELAAGQSLGGTDYNADIYLLPVWEPKNFSVTRYDRIGSPDAYTELGSVTGEAPYGSTVSGLDFGENSAYRGYVFRAETAVSGENYTELTVDVVNGSGTNAVYRYYEPRRYSVAISGNVPEYSYAGDPITHVFGTATELPVPEMTGYRFIRWEKDDLDGLWEAGRDVTLTDGKWVIPADAYANENEAISIKVKAVWELISYAVTYDGDTLFGNDVSDPANFPTSCPYNEEFRMDRELTRTGYTFLGWRIKGSDGEFTKNFRIAKNTRVDDVTLEAGWQANAYTATFDPGEGTGGTETVGVTYDGSLPAVTPPTREGYDFAGYRIGEELYYNADGTPVPGKLWQIADNATLTAKWTVRSHTVTVRVVDAADNDRSADVEIKVNTLDYTAPVAYDYGTTIIVSVTVRATVNGKLVKWNGSAIAPHAKTNSATFVLGDGDETVTVVILPMAETPAFGVDYVRECLVIPSGVSGNFRVETEEGNWAFRVEENGAITSFDSNHTDPTRLSDLFGKVLRVVRCGVENVSSDSAPQEIQLAARPAAPVEGANVIRVDDIISEQPGLEVKTAEGDPAYEFACTRTPDVNPEDWQTEPRFTGLNAGTPYYLHVRVKATETRPHGETYTVQRNTRPDRYLEEWIKKLNNDFAPYTGGEHVDQLLRDAENEAKALSPSATYEEDLDSIYRGVASRVEFEKSRDDAIADLRAYYESLAATRAYNSSGADELSAALEAAIAAINSDEMISEADVQRIAFSAHNDMDAVRVNYLSSVTPQSEVHLYSPLGLPKGTGFTAEPGNAATVRSQLRAALKRGTVVLLTGDSVAEAKKLLLSKDAVAFYRMFCSSAPEEGDLLEFRLLIPENLRSGSGFSVAYYDNRSETVTVLATKREGNELVFLAPAVADFVVFCEHVTHTAPILAILSVILVLQICAIALLLVGRQRSRSYAVAFPLLAALALRVSPAGSLTAVWILLALVAVLAVVLICLVLSTGIVWRRKETPDTDADDELNFEPPQEPEPTLLDETVDTAAEQGPPLDTPTEDELPPNGYVASGTLDPEKTETDNAVDWTGARAQPEPEPVSASNENPTATAESTEENVALPAAKPEEPAPEEDPAIPAFAEAGQNDDPDFTNPAPATTEKAGPDPDNPFAAEADALWDEAPRRSNQPDFKL